MIDSFSALVSGGLVDMVATNSTDSFGAIYSYKQLNGP